MKICSSFNNQYNKNNNSPSQSFKGIPKNPHFLPNIVGKMGKLAGEYVSMPEQKLFLATTALMFVPLIDLKFADEDKKTDAAIKSASKAMMGGLTGVTIRAAFLKFTDKFIGLGKHNVINSYLLPPKARELNAKLSASRNEAAKIMLAKKVKQYSQTMGTLFAILFMTFFSNSKVDVPLTSDMQDLISGVVKDNKTWLKSLSDVSKARKTKIRNWFEKKKKFFSVIKEKFVKVINVLKESPGSAKKEESNK